MVFFLLNPTRNPPPEARQTAKFVVAAVSLPNERRRWRRSSPSYALIPGPPAAESVLGVRKVLRAFDRKRQREKNRFALNQTKAGRYGAATPEGMRRLRRLGTALHEGALRTLI